MAGRGEPADGALGRRRMRGPMKEPATETPAPAIGFLETGSISEGVEASDALVKKAQVELLLTTIVPRGKYLIMIGGAVAEVEQSLGAGIAVAADSVVDHFLIQNRDPKLAPAIQERVKCGGV